MYYMTATKKTSQAKKSSTTKRSSSTSAKKGTARKTSSAKTSSQKVDYYPNRMTVAVSALAGTVLVLISVITVMNSR